MSTSGVDLSDARSLSNETLKDLLKTTLANLPWEGGFETLQKYHDYPICNIWFAKDRIVFDGGTQIIRNVQITENGSAKMTLPYEPATVNVVDTQARLNIPWVQATADWSTSRQEMMRNRSKAKLIDLAKSRRLAATMDFANLLEEKAWKSPSSASDVTNPRGIPYWITPIVTGQTYGHVGQNPVYTDSNSASDCGGIDASSSTYSRWRNYADRWDAKDSHVGAITAEDIKKITRMLRRLRFMSPTFVKDVNDGQYANLRLYTGEKNLESLEEMARESNDSLGADVGKYAGTTIIKNLPLVWLEQLDNSLGVDTTYPLYAINHDYFQPFIMEGDYMRESEPMNDREQHDVFTVFYDMQFNFMITNRQRCGGIISAVVV